MLGPQRSPKVEAPGSRGKEGAEDPDHLVKGMRSGDYCQVEQPAQSKAANKSEIWEEYYHMNRERRVLGDGRRSYQGRKQGSAGLAGEKIGTPGVAEWWVGAMEG